MLLECYCDCLYVKIIVLKDCVDIVKNMIVEFKKKLLIYIIFWYRSIVRVDIEI